MLTAEWVAQSTRLGSTTRKGRGTCHENALGVLWQCSGDRRGMCSLLVPRVAKGAVAEVSSGPVRSLGCALQHLLSLPRVTEELQFPGEKLHLHRHRLILLTVNAKGAPCALRRRAYAERLTVMTGAYNALVSEDLVSCSFTEVFQSLWQA